LNVATLTRTYEKKKKPSYCTLHPPKKRAPGHCSSPAGWQHCTAAKHPRGTQATNRKLRDLCPAEQESTPLQARTLPAKDAFPNCARSWGLICFGRTSPHGGRALGATHSPSPTYGSRTRIQPQTVGHISKVFITVNEQLAEPGQARRCSHAPALPPARLS